MGHALHPVLSNEDSTPEPSLAEILTAEEHLKDLMRDHHAGDLLHRDLPEKLSDLFDPKLDRELFVYALIATCKAMGSGNLQALKMHILLSTPIEQYSFSGHLVRKLQKIDVLYLGDLITQQSALEKDPELNEEDLKHINEVIENEGLQQIVDFFEWDRPSND